MQEMLRQLLKMNLSDENLERINPFIQLEQKYIALRKRYGDLFDELQSAVLKKVCYHQYATGGQTIHRGFYSPSALDIITGGCNRGRVLKRLPKEGKYDYEYLQDINGRILCCKRYETKSKEKRFLAEVEILLYQDNCVIGLTFLPDADFLLISASECKYENTKIVRYEHVLFNGICPAEGCTEINVEVFDYSDELLKTIDWYRYTPSIKLLTECEISLYRDQDGNLQEYVVKEGNFLEQIKKPDFTSRRYSAKKRERVFHDMHRLPSTGTSSTGDGSVFP